MKNINFKYILSVFLGVNILGACQSSDKTADATGTFEATEIIVSAEATGKILALDITEGQALAKDSLVGQIDPLSISLQRAQIEASIGALSEKSGDAQPQMAVTRAQIEGQKQQIGVLRQQEMALEREVKRLENLVKSEAAPQKQLDDVRSNAEVLKQQIRVAEAQVAVLEKQAMAQKLAVETQNRAILSEKKPLEQRLAQADDQLKRTRIANPVAGHVLVKYAEAGEITTAGKPLYKIADLSKMVLRAYITGAQLNKIKVNQKVTVTVDNGDGQKRTLSGLVTWISDKAEFTPKTIQTKDERGNLVYAVKIAVANDGVLKIGMYADVTF